ncbi:hypothetical protein [Candidatus Nephthysia bennettiae]|uniref:Uncharacterized protein n=1 Tax=Candidatus Nephthysia bennettiae TaxID=3127016 RepID=A0A934K3E4_9BACT|nr:hypothetical protein [Candidatus Dormibacteraeota bacterium]
MQRSPARGVSIGWLLRAAAIVAVAMVSMSVLGQLRLTWEEISNPQVQAAQQRAQIAEADNRAANLRRDTANQQARQAVEPSWQQRIVATEGVIVVALLVAIPLAIVAILVALALLFRRHLSIPTRDGRVPLVGLDRELSREALIGYQQMLGGRGWSANIVAMDRERIAAAGELVEQGEREEVAG